MVDLPITTTSAPAKAAAIKSPANDDAAQQEAQDFGGVLSRQVADSARPATSKQTSSGNSNKQAAEQVSTDTAAADDAATTTPADILATLLAQQNQATLPAPDVTDQADPARRTDIADQALATAQPAANLQPALILQTTAATSGQPVRAIDAALATIAGNAMAASAIAPPKLEVSVKDGKGYAETLKASGMKDVSLSSNAKNLGTHTISDTTTASQQPVILPLVTGAAAPASPLAISTPVNQHAWGNEFGQKIIWMANQRNQSAELHLNPPELGPLEVVLKMNGDQATAMFTSPHAAVRDAIEQAIPKLREMLADNGIMLGQAMVSDHTAKNGHDNAPRKPPSRSPAGESNVEGGSLQEVRVTGVSRHNGMVDTFA